MSRHSTRTLGIKTHTDPRFPIGCCPLIPMTTSQFWDIATNPPKGTPNLIIFILNNLCRKVYVF